MPKAKQECIGLPGPVSSGKHLSLSGSPIYPPLPSLGEIRFPKRKLFPRTANTLWERTGSEKNMKCHGLGSVSVMGSHACSVWSLCDFFSVNPLPQLSKMSQNGGNKISQRNCGDLKQCMRDTKVLVHNKNDTVNFSGPPNPRVVPSPM